MQSLQNIFSGYELTVLSSIVQVGEATYKDLIEDRTSMLSHHYFDDTRGRIRTKLVQMQCEIESHEPNFPFAFRERSFLYNQYIPELHTKDIVLHIGRSPAASVLPPKSKYKIQLSNNNMLLERQMVLDSSMRPPYAFEPFYGMLVFGGRHQSFIAVQFPSPGYKGILETINVPKITFAEKSEEAEIFERKKVQLKKELLARRWEDIIS